jgi:predicted metal-dependent hydrolase
MSGFERKTLDSGKPNPNYIDLCDEDPTIAGQKFVCLSFVSPEKILKKRELYLFEQFLKQWDFKKSMDKFHDFIQFISYKYNLKVDSLVNDYTEFIQEEATKLKENSIEDEYKTFLDKNEDSLTERFQKANEFQTSVRGLKVRGAFNTQEEAELRCKKLRDLDPSHDIFVGPVGVWMPWDPDAYKTGRVEFMEDELNQLHKEKLKNEEKAKEDFEKRIKDVKKKAIEENIKNAQKSGNKLTQTLDEQGNLVGVKETVDFDSRTATTDEETKAYNESVLDANQK